MLRHFFVTALIQSGLNAKVAQTLAGHHSASFTLDQYADAVPEQLEEAGEKVANVLLQASGSKSVAVTKLAEVKTSQVIELERAPGEIARGLTLGTARANARASNLARGLAKLSNSRPSGSKVVPGHTNQTQPHSK